MEWNVCAFSLQFPHHSDPTQPTSHHFSPHLTKPTTETRQIIKQGTPSRNSPTSASSDSCGCCGFLSWGATPYVLPSLLLCCQACMEGCTVRIHPPPVTIDPIRTHTFSFPHHQFQPATPSYIHSHTLYTHTLHTHTNNRSAGSSCRKPSSPALLPSASSPSSLALSAWSSPPWSTSWRWCVESNVLDVLWVSDHDAVHHTDIHTHPHPYILPHSTRTRAHIYTFTPQNTGQLQSHARVPQRELHRSEKPGKKGRMTGSSTHCRCQDENCI